MTDTSEDFDDRPLLDRIDYVLANPVAGIDAHCHDLEELLREAATEIETLRARVAEVQGWAAEWHRHCQTVATLLDLREPEGATFAAEASEAIAALRARVGELLEFYRLSVQIDDDERDYYERSQGILHGQGVEKDEIDEVSKASRSIDEKREHLIAVKRRLRSLIDDAVSGPDLLSATERKSIQADAEWLWKRLQANDIGGFSGGNRPFYIMHAFKEVIEKYGRRDVGLTWSQNDLAAGRRARTLSKGAAS